MVTNSSQFHHKLFVKLMTSLRQVGVIYFSQYRKENMKGDGAFNLIEQHIHIRSMICTVMLLGSVVVIIVWKGGLLILNASGGVGVVVWK